MPSPLAKRYIDKLQGPKETLPAWAPVASELISDAHFFECSSVLDLAAALAADNNLLEDLIFLPAEKTWIEFKCGAGQSRVAYLITGAADDLQDIDSFRFSVFGRSSSGSLIAPQAAILSRNFGRNGTVAEAKLIGGLLCLINSPKHIGRVVRGPDRSAIRTAKQNSVLAGSYPLRAWTTLKLKVNAKIKDADGEEYTVGVSGKKCLHFVRSHFRVRCGQLEFVSAHWRGNPAYGTKQTRYLVEA